MADSPSHKFGQIVGKLLEIAIEPELRTFTQIYGLYLDVKGDRPVRRGKKKVSWTDEFGNSHDLDFVLEKGGTDKEIGTPVAFIETAWRRYTKHSRNKAQEIQGAILPLATKYRYSAPFCGVILAGDFTAGSLTQLQSQGFSVLHFSYDSVVRAFEVVGIDARFDEDTPDEAFRPKISAWEGLSETELIHVAKKLLEINSREVRQFIKELEYTITRQVEMVYVLPLYGQEYGFPTIAEAIIFVEGYDESLGSSPIVKYEVSVRYNNGDRIDGMFRDKLGVAKFLRTYQPPPFHITQ